MAKEEAIEVEGLVTEVLPDRNFRVQLQNDHVVLAYLAGRMSKFRIRVLVGDMVTLELFPYDLSRGRILSPQGRRAASAVQAAEAAEVIGPGVPLGDA